MSKQYGLIVPNKEKGKVIVRPSIFDEDSDSDGDAPVRPTGLKRALKKQEKITQSKAIEEDPTVYQYDEVYDDIEQKRNESKLSRKDLDRKPKYISRLLAAAEKRKKENERRIERQVQKEREAEGEEFKDKESFVTTAYRKKLEEMKELEEQEKREEYLEAIGDVTKQGNLDGFYRHLYEQKVKYEDGDEAVKVKEEKEEVKEADEVNEAEIEQEEESTERPSKKRKYRRREKSDGSDEEDPNENEKIEVKKEHLPSNLDADSDFSIDSSDSDDEGSKKVVEEKANVELIVDKEKLTEEKAEVKKVEPVSEEVEVKVEKIKPKKPKIDIWKKRTVGEVFDAALMRYFERKALRES